MYKILCIDDNDNNLFTLKALLEQLDGIEVYTALSAQDGLKVLLSQSIDLIFLDIQMPQIDGFEAAKLIKSNKHTANIPIIFITAVFKSEEFKSRGYKVGAIEYISKPIDDYQLLNKVRLYMKINDSEKKLVEKNIELLYNQKNLKVAYKELKEKDEILIEQSRHAAMSDIISMIAHQWKQPISAISMVANNLLADVEFDDIKSENVKNSAMKVLEHTKNLSKTIDDFKSFFKPTKNAQEVKVDDILEQNIDILSESIKTDGITLKKEYHSNTLINTYTKELLQVFISILNNAHEALIKDKIQNPVIWINTSEDDEEIYISICDNANGIDSEIISKIYDPYFSTKNIKNVAGLGLYISKTILQKHLKGTIEVSNREDGGTCFKICLLKIGVNDG